MIDTQQSVKDNAELNSFLKTAETVCIISFTVEYVVRVSLCWSRPTENPSIIKYILKVILLARLLKLLFAAAVATLTLRCLCKCSTLLPAFLFCFVLGAAAVLWLGVLILPLLMQPMNLVDLFAIAPFYIELILAGRRHKLLLPSPLPFPLHPHYLAAPLK